MTIHRAFASKYRGVGWNKSSKKRQAIYSVDDMPIQLSIFKDENAIKRAKLEKKIMDISRLQGRNSLTKHDCEEAQRLMEMCRPRLMDMSKDRNNLTDDHENNKKRKSQEAQITSPASPHSAMLKNDTEEASKKVPPKEDEQGEDAAMPDAAPSAATGNDENDRMYLENRTTEGLAMMIQGYGPAFSAFADSIREASFNGRDVAKELDKGSDAFDRFLRDAGVERVLIRHKIYNIFDEIPRRS